MLGGRPHWHCIEEVAGTLVLTVRRGAHALQVLGLAGNVLSRRYEFQADGFAVALGRAEPLKGALQKLDVKNRSAVNVDAWCVLRSPFPVHSPCQAACLHATNGKLPCESSLPGVTQRAQLKSLCEYAACC